MSKRSHRATDQLAEYVDGLPNISRSAGGKNLRSARLISNLQYMEEHRDIGANRNAPPTAGRAPTAGGSWGSDSAGAGDWDRRSGERRGR